MKSLASLVLMAALSLVPFEAALSLQPPQDSPRANTTGPTIAQLRAAPLGTPGSELGRQTAGAIVRVPQGGFRYRYQLPDRAVAMFGRCGTDERCDQAVFIGELGRGGAAEIDSLSQALFGYNGLYVSDPQEQFRIVTMDSFGRPGELALIQAFALSNRSAAETLHSRYAGFASVRAAMREQLGRGR